MEEVNHLFRLIIGELGRAKKNKIANFSIINYNYFEIPAPMKTMFFAGKSIKIGGFQGTDFFFRAKQLLIPGPVAAQRRNNFFFRLNNN